MDGDGRVRSRRTLAGQSGIGAQGRKELDTSGLPAWETPGEGSIGHRCRWGWGGRGTEAAVLWVKSHWIAISTYGHIKSAERCLKTSQNIP